MAVDMKELIAEAAKKLMMENHKKLTVTDIVTECQITRQTFYYHFEDIPALLKWELERNMNQMLQKFLTQEEPEQGLKYCFLVAINAFPYIKKGMGTNYRSEIERLVVEYVYRFGEKIVETESLYQNYSRSEISLILRYHSYGVLGILRTWTEEDTKHLDQIVHQVYELLIGRISPYS